MTDRREQRGGTAAGEQEAREKGGWVESAGEGVVPDELGGSNAPDEKLGDDPPQMSSAALGETTGSDEPATERGIDPAAGDDADATTHGGPKPPEDAEPDLRDAAAVSRQVDRDAAG